MPAVVLGETVNAQNPLLQFFHQTSGIMSDVASLSFSVFDFTNDNEIVASTPVDLDAVEDGGARLGPGRYTSDLAVAAGTWLLGTYEIRWVYQATVGGPSRAWRQRFEVVSPGMLATGAAYQGYGDTFELLKHDAFNCYTVEQLHETLMEVGEWLQDVTGRFFEPRFMRQRLNSTASTGLAIDDPIIGVQQILMMGAELQEALLSVELTSLRVYNRHLEGLRSPDDRDNPRIEFGADYIPGTTSPTGAFYETRQGVAVDGVFGYTEYDGSPVGAVPRKLKRVVGMLALRRLQDPFGIDVFTSNPGRIKEAKTRDQQVKFAGANEGAVGPITGDKIVDDILMSFMRPPYYGAVSEAGYRWAGRAYMGAK